MVRHVTTVARRDDEHLDRVEDEPHRADVAVEEDPPRGRSIAIWPLRLMVNSPNPDATRRLERAVEEDPPLQLEGRNRQCVAYGSGGFTTTVSNGTQTARVEARIYMSAQS